MALKDLMHKYVTYRNLIYLNMFGVFVGIVLIVSGLSAALVYCNDEGEANLYVLPSFKEDYKTYALQRLQDAGKFECGTYWRMQWGIWSLQTAWLIMLGFVLWYKMMPQYLHGLNSIATVCIAWHIWNAEDLLKLKPVTDDPLYTYGVVSFLGLMACIICDFFTIFCAGGLVHQQQQLQWREHDNGMFNGTGNGGRKVSKVEEVA